MPNPPFRIVPATADMLPDIVQLEEACFSAPWTRKMLEAELTGNQFARFLVAVGCEEGKTTESIIGYHCFWIVFEELRLMNLAVRASMRREGIGQALALEAVRVGAGLAASRALLEVRASNEAAQGLYRKLGFVPISTRRQYYTNPTEDAVIMELVPLVVPENERETRLFPVGGGSVSAH
ncbi:MAG: ribosomal protein S18-alanine N-acetyltransferase [Nitrospira sp.]|nr:ribosomal protein S18-alanine N-acetyltransferase [Nitrospira sp.]